MLLFLFCGFGLALSDEESWFTPAVLRSSVVKTLAGDTTALLSAVLKRMFDPTGHHATESGVLLTRPDGSQVRIFFKFMTVISDEAALRAFWRCIGAGGIRICMWCLNAE